MPCFGVEISFTLDARDMLLLYFFTGIGLNARLGDLISGVVRSSSCWV